MRSLFVLAALVAATPFAAGFALPAPAAPGADLLSGPVTMNFVTGFSPPVVTTTPGGSVTWRNTDTVIHTATSLAGGAPNSGLMNPGTSYTATFSAAGATVYNCSLHPWMVGVVIVN